MSLKAIRLQAADSARLGRLTNTAILFARENGAHLIGLGVSPPYIAMLAADAIAATVKVDKHRKT